MNGNIELENMTEDEVFERYLIGGTSEELDEPVIQRLLIKNGFANILVGSVLFITDEQVIEDIYTSGLIEDKNYIFIQGKIKSMEFNEVDTDKHIFNLGKFTIIENETKKEYILNRSFMIKEEIIDQFKNQIEPDKNDIIVVIAQQEKEMCCFIRKIS